MLGYILKLHLIWKKYQINIFLVLFNNFDVIILKIKKILIYFYVFSSKKRSHYKYQTHIKKKKKI